MENEERKFILHTTPMAKFVLTFTCNKKVFGLLKKQWKNFLIKIISKLQTNKKSITEYEKFNKNQKIISDFYKKI
ncbi:hypothetical protein [Flavobacterium sp.]|uniref:hypothetical protein n=1 Tax=Flavobacterium sp. TaxID=239 RepID=UPI00286E2728|nr:hypothetical protein [Flavobacterium sp.]